MTDLPTVVCYGDSNTHGADGPTGAATRATSAGRASSPRELAGRAVGGRGGAERPDHGLGRPVHAGPQRADVPAAVPRVARAGRRPRDHARHERPEGDLPARRGRRSRAGAGSLVDLARAERRGSRRGPARRPPRRAAAAGSTTRRSRRSCGASRPPARRSRRLAPLYREVGGAGRGPRSSTRAPWSRTDPADGVHLDAAAHATLGRAIAAAVERLLLAGRPARAAG